MTTAYLLNHPQHVEYVLQTNHRNYRKSPLVERMRPLFGNGLLIAENELWERQRKLIQPSFKRKNLDLLNEHILKVISAHVSSWDERAQSGEEFNLSEDMSVLTIEIVMQTFFGAALGDAGARLYQAMLLINEVMAKRIWDVTTLATKLPTRENRAYDAALKTVHGIVAEIIEARRRNAVPAEDLLGILMGACDDTDGAAMSDQQLQDEVVTLIVAGFESTASLLAWSFFFLHQHPHILENLRNEADMVL